VNREPALLAKNPLGGIPVLELDDGTCIAESVAICRYFEASAEDVDVLGRDRHALLGQEHARATGGRSRRVGVELQTARVHYAGPSIDPCDGPTSSTPDACRARGEAGCASIACSQLSR